MILSASRRTDIPRFYSEWFRNRIRAGYALTRNPMNHSQVSRVTLDPAVVDCIVFWTKDASPLMETLPELNDRGWRYCFQYTVTPYGGDVEPDLRPKRQIVENFQRLSRTVGTHRLRWRYDPILLTDTYTPAFHATAFANLCGQLAGYTDTVVISFVDVYAKIKGSGIREIPPQTVETLAASIGKTAKSHGLSVQTCCEQYDLSPYGIAPGACLDRSFLEKACGYALDIGPDKGQRLHCRCAESIDVGAYNTCVGGCTYCYATTKQETAERNYRLHDPREEFLLGRRLEGDKIHDRKQKSHRAGGGQLRLF